MTRFEGYHFNYISGKSYHLSAFLENVKFVAIGHIRQFITVTVTSVRNASEAVNSVNCELG